PRKLNANISRDLETITLQCLEKKPENRYQSAHDLAEDLRRWLSHKPIQARPPGPIGRLWRWTQRKPAIAVSADVLSLATAAAVITAFGLVAYQSRVALRIGGLEKQREALVVEAKQRVAESNVAFGMALQADGRYLESRRHLETAWDQFTKLGSDRRQNE